MERTFIDEGRASSVDPSVLWFFPWIGLRRRGRTRVRFEMSLLLDWRESAINCPRGQKES